MTGILTGQLPPAFDTNLYKPDPAKVIFNASIVFSSKKLLMSVGINRTANAKMN